MTTNVCSRTVERRHWRDDNRHRGFSLYELMITLAIASGLMAAGSSFYGFVERHRVTAEINQFLTHLSLARSESFKRGIELALCPSSNGRDCDDTGGYSGWHNGVLLFADVDGDGRLEAEDSVIRVLSGTPRLKIKSTRGRSHIVFRSNGLASGTNRTFTFCPTGGRSAPRYIVMSNTGRARVSSKPPVGSTSPELRC